MACRLSSSTRRPSTVRVRSPPAASTTSSPTCVIARSPCYFPGGLPVAFAPDVGEGHVLAAEEAEVGDRFILSDAYFSLEEMAQRVADLVGLSKTPPVLPLWVGRLVSGVGEQVSRLTRRPPLIPKGQLHLLQWGARPMATHAKEELGWRMTPFDVGLRRTLEFLDGGGRP